MARTRKDRPYGNVVSSRGQASQKPRVQQPPQTSSNQQTLSPCPRCSQPGRMPQQDTTSMQPIPDNDAEQQQSEPLPPQHAPVKMDSVASETGPGIDSIIEAKQNLAPGKVKQGTTRRVIHKYRVKWEGKTQDEASWVSLEIVARAPKALARFFDENPNVTIPSALESVIAEGRQILDD
ncbi:hypothetical protein EJ03DRAFT_193831 [Teratosphaeria nubilosa]|uniref:Chromo domain-containing protein n=1 Tax=Teratosphaeria nubilosa TaxID=161662 RepID=A0A6G1L075_9PEZI|nr:hypothetical protein EJ03DRAFT_193831 [Teratosphaeria nubilosa]